MSGKLITDFLFFILFIYFFVKEIITDIWVHKKYNSYQFIKKKIQLIKKTQMSYCSSMASLLSPSPTVLLQHKVI